MKTHNFILLLFFIPIFLVGQENTHAFAHRGMGLSTAAPLKKGTINYYNYYLFYNELEFAPTNRFSFSVGSLLVPEFIEYGEIYLMPRMRYAIPINERMSWALTYQGILYADLEFNDFDLSGVWLSVMTYSSSRFTGSLHGGIARNSYEKQKLPVAGGNLIWFPGKKKHFGIAAEYGFGEGGTTNPFTFDSGSGQILGFGPQFGGKRWALQIFGFGFYEGGYGWEWIPGVSFRAQLRKPKVKAITE
jgi:hypothetical protein